MKTNIPFNAGDFVVYHAFGKDYRYMIMGHVWWPVEKKNAYYMLPVDEYGEPKDENVQYNWDHDGSYQLFTPKEQAA